MASSWSMAPSPSQKKMLPGRRYSSTWRTFGITVFGVRQLLRLVDVDLKEVADVLGAGLVAVLARLFAVIVEGLFGRLQLGGEHHIGIAVPGGPGDGVAAHHAGDPDRRVGLLIGARP